MNKKDIVTIQGGHLEADALRILRETPGMAVLDETPRGAHRGADAILHFAGSRVPVIVETARRANAATAWRLVQDADAGPGIAVLLIADATTADSREILARHGIGVVDGLGNAHIELPGLLLHLEGRRRPGRHAAPAPARLSGKAGVVAQALLLAPERDWHVRDLAEAAGVSSGLSHRVIARLEREGLMIAEGAGPRRVRRLVSPTTLLDVWAEENADRPHRTPGYVLSRSPEQLIRTIGAGLESHGVPHALTGAAAASLVAPFATAVPVVDVWAAERTAPEEVLRAAGAEPVTDGANVVLLQARDDTPLAFRERREGTWIANRFRLYVDLRRDPRRGREQAEHLRREVIGF